MGTVIFKDILAIYNLIKPWLKYNFLISEIECGIFNIKHFIHKLGFKLFNYLETSIAIYFMHLICSVV